MIAEPLAYEGTGVAEKKGFLALRLKDLRQKAGLSQPELAEAAQVPVGTLRMLEQGRREPTFSTLLKLARGLGVKLSAFEPEEEEKPAAKKRKGK